MGDGREFQEEGIYIYLCYIYTYEGQLEFMKQMSRLEYRGSAGDYQADEQAGVAGLSWRLSSR